MDVVIVCETIEERKEIIEILETYNFTLPYFSKISEASEKIPANSKMYFTIQDCLSSFAANSPKGYSIHTLTPFVKNCISVHEVKFHEEMGKDISEKQCIILKPDVFLQNKGKYFLSIHPHYFIDLKAEYLTETAT